MFINTLSKRLIRGCFRDKRSGYFIISGSSWSHINMASLVSVWTVFLFLSKIIHCILIMHAAKFHISIQIQNNYRKKITIALWILLKLNMGKVLMTGFYVFAVLGKIYNYIMIYKSEGAVEVMHVTVNIHWGKRDNLLSFPDFLLDFSQILLCPTEHDMLRARSCLYTFAACLGEKWLL